MKSKNFRTLIDDGKQYRFDNEKFAKIIAKTSESSKKILPVKGVNQSHRNS